jgi:hypothetical protein
MEKQSTGIEKLFKNQYYHNNEINIEKGEGFNFPKTIEPEEWQFYQKVGSTGYQFDA